MIISAMAMELHVMMEVMKILLLATTAVNQASGVTVPCVMIGLLGL